MVKEQDEVWRESTSNSNTTLTSFDRDGHTMTTYLDLSIPCPETIEHDQHWQRELMALFSEVALKRERQCKPTYTSELIPGLRASADILNIVMMKMSTIIDDSVSDNYMSEVMQRSSQYLSDVYRITLPVKGSWFGIGSRKVEPPLEEMAKLFCEFVDVLELGLNLLGNRFKSMEYQLQWIKCSSIFTEEIRADMKWASYLMCK